MRFLTNRRRGSTIWRGQVYRFAPTTALTYSAPRVLQTAAAKWRETSQKLDLAPQEEHRVDAFYVQNNVGKQQHKQEPPPNKEACQNGARGLLVNQAIGECCKLGPEKPDGAQKPAPELFFGVRFCDCFKKHSYPCECGCGYEQRCAPQRVCRHDALGRTVCLRMQKHQKRNAENHELSENYQNQSVPLPHVENIEQRMRKVNEKL